MEIGTDICSAKRIQKVYKRFGEKFIDRILTKDEKKYVMESSKLLISRLTARFAAKEAIAKVLGTGIGKDGVSFHDIEITRENDSRFARPKVKLSGAAEKKAQELEFSNWSISISHEDDYVVATALAI